MSIGLKLCYSCNQLAHVKVIEDKEADYVRFICAKCRNDINV